jgi:hypothetical protein
MTIPLTTFPLMTFPLILLGPKVGSHLAWSYGGLGQPAAGVR